MNHSIYRHTLFILICALTVFAVQTASAQTNDFTYQGRLTDNSMPATGNYDFFFTLHPDVANAITLGSVQRLNVPVSNGIFTVQLDFSAANFNGPDRYLQISVKPAGSANPYTPLTPRQLITSAPYAVRSLAAATSDNATNATQLGGVPANQYVQTGDTRLSDARTPTAGSGNYVQNNGGTAQTGTSFNIDGTGAANIFNAQTQYNIAGQRILSNAGSNNLFVGREAGQSNTGTGNSFVGYAAGNHNTDGNFNSFFGEYAGLFNTTGIDNSFFGRSAGQANTTGIDNSFVGYSAGSSNTTGEQNSFVGANAGKANTTGLSNAFFGSRAGEFNTTGYNNSFVGERAGQSNTTGAQNLFVGALAGLSNTTGSNNTLIGYNANVNTGNMTNAAAIGTNALVTQNNSLVLGSINGTNGATASTNVGIGTSAPNSKLQVTGGNIYITQPNSLIITSPNGACWFVTVNNAGALSTISVTCP